MANDWDLKLTIDTWNWMAAMLSDRMTAFFCPMGGLGILPSFPQL
jgi:hypothetical protein